MWADFSFDDMQYTGWARDVKYRKLAGGTYDALGVYTPGGEWIDAKMVISSPSAAFSDHTDGNRFDILTEIELKSGDYVFIPDAQIIVEIASREYVFDKKFFHYKSVKKYENVENPEGAQI